MDGVSGFGKRMLLARVASDMTQDDLAKRIGKSSATICRYERGERWPTIKTVALMADALGVSASELAGFD